MKNVMDEKKDNTNFQFSEGIHQILDKILDPTIKIVSFDVFDTLLFRPASTPVDIFRLMENKLNIPNFHNMRVTAEAEARRFREINVQDVTLNDIYHTYSRLFGLTESEANELKQEELDIEYKLLYARKSAKFLYEQARKAGKQIIIISDMYLSSEFLDRCLSKNGYKGYSRIYVSSETGVLKSSKMMFRLVLSDLAENQLLPSEVLHIGDNKRSDVDCAAAVGINAVHLPKPADLRNACKHHKRLYTYILSDVLNSNNAMLYGFLINLYFDDPFIDYEKDSFFNGDATLMGYWFSPLLIGFSKWLIENIEGEQVEQLLFVWRDGYLPLELLKIMRPLFTERPMDIRQIYMGRALRMPFQSLDKNGFFATFVDYPLRPEITVDFFIKKRLLCNNTEQYKKILNIFFKHGYINGNAPIGKFENYRGFLHELEPFFIDNTKEITERYSKYIRSQISLDKKTSIFDRSPRGKSSRFLQQYFGIKSNCITTEIYDIPKAKLEDINLPVKSYLEYGSYYINKMGRIWAMLFERIISDAAPGFADIVENKNGISSVLLDTPEENEIFLEADSIVKTVQSAIVNFTRDFSEVLGKYLPYINIDRHGVFDYAVDVLSVPHIKDAELIVKINPDKSTLAPIDENTFINWYNSKFKKQVKRVTPTESRMVDRVRLKGYIISERLGILTQARAVYRFIVRKPQNPSLTVESIQMQTNAHIAQINEIVSNDISVLFLGGVPKEESKFFNRLSDLNDNLNFVFVAAGFLRIPTCFNFPCLSAPESFGFWGIEGADKEIPISAAIKQAVNNKPYLRDLVERRALRGYSKSVATLLAFEAERYFRELITALPLRVLMVWNNWGNNSVVPAEIARENGIPVISAERGFIEGTIMLSPAGYGRDEINLNPSAFCDLPVSSEELTQAKNVIKFLGETGFNRYEQPVNNILYNLKKKLNNGKPNILFVGSFDCENPAYPQNENAKRYYSPVLGTAREAVLYISKLAKKNNWNIIFKPHPLMDKIDHSKDKFSFPSNIHYIKEANINELIDMADAVICMISGVSYIALIRGKPLVELSYTPLKGKGCCYEAFSFDTIETAIQEALNNGFTKEQRKSFVRHVAQINKYYFFDNLNARSIRYGRPIEDAVQILQSTINKS